MYSNQQSSQYRNYLRQDPIKQICLENKHRESKSCGSLLNDNQQEAICHALQLEQVIHKQTEANLQQRCENERIINTIAQGISQQQNLEEILVASVSEVRQSLQVDRVLIYRFESDWSGVVVAESVAPGWLSVLGTPIKDSFFGDGLEETYVYDCIQVTEDIHTANLSNCHVDLLSRLQIRANLVLPVLHQGKLWGLLAANHCSGPRKWLPAEIQLLKQVATHLSIAIHQAHLVFQLHSQTEQEQKWIQNYQVCQARVQELEKLNRLKDEFLSTISHELRAPVSNMKMALQMLEITLNRHFQLYPEAAPKPENSPLSRYLQILENECKREVDLINDLLDLQRLEAENQTLSLSDIPLQTWLPRIIKPYQERAKNRQQHLRIDCPTTLRPLISDAACLERILIELLTNACKYTPPGEEIILTAIANQGIAQFTVRNTGTAISERELPLIFEKFYRIPNSDHWHQGGTGLGLALVNKLTQRLGGSLTVTSQNNQVTFTLIVPNQQPAS